MQKSKFYIYFLFIIFCIFVINACTNDGFVNPVAEKDEIVTHFRVQLSKNSILRSATDSLDGTLAENKINKLSFFIIGLKDNNELDWTWVKHVSILAPHDLMNSPFTVLIKTTAGKKHVFVGANMSDAQISSFCTNKGVYTSSENTYTDVKQDFADSLGRGFVMFGQMLNATAPFSPDIEVVENDTIKATLELSRVVSKVALTYTPKTQGSKFAPLFQHPLIDGYIDVDSVYFMLNSTGKSIGFVPNGITYNLFDYIAPNVDPEYQTLYHYKVDPTQQFMFYSPQGVVQGNPLDYNVAAIKLPIEIQPGDENPYCQGLEEYIPPSAATGDKHTHYKSSLYCLENKVNSSGFDAELLNEFRKGLNTHVIVAAKYVPKTIWHYDGSDIIDKTISIDSDLFNVTNDDVDNGPYTFYAELISAVGDTPVLYKYYTYAAKKHLEQEETAPNFITYKGGYGYYSTFVTQEALANDADYDLNRNHYYILNVKQFTPPGAVYPEQLYMLVNSQTVEWKLQKEIDVPLD